MAMQMHAKLKGREVVSPERTKVWTEPNKKKNLDKKVPVVYYLCRNGQLEHPHFMEVPLSSPDGLYLRDVINRLNLLRGKGIAGMYSWSSKRSYKTGFVWHDLTETDLIHPAHNNEYILKGSEIVEPCRSTLEATSFRADLSSESGRKLNSEFPVMTRRRNQSWSSVDLNEYHVYKSDSVVESSRKFNSDASTQTDDRRRRSKAVNDELESQREIYESTELSRGEISPPPSDSSPETLESLMKADGRLVLCNNSKEDYANQRVESCPIGNKMKASSVLMQLLSCGSMSFRDCGTLVLRDQGMSLIGRPNRGVGNEAGKEEVSNGFSGVILEDKEYFSGSLIETRKEEVPTLKRSSSYNADRRSSQKQMSEKEMDGVRGKCIPRKPKALPNKKEGSVVNSSESRITNNGQQGSKKLESLQKVDIGAK